MDRRNAGFKRWQVYALLASGFRFERPDVDRELAVVAWTSTIGRNPVDAFEGVQTWNRLSCGLQAFDVVAWDPNRIWRSTRKQNKAKRMRSAKLLHSRRVALAGFMVLALSFLGCE